MEIFAPQSTSDANSAAAMPLRYQRHRKVVDTNNHGIELQSLTLTQTVVSPRLAFSLPSANINKHLHVFCVTQVMEEKPVLVSFTLVSIDTIDVHIADQDGRFIPAHIHDQC
jgi:hypothetical protein